MREALGVTTVTFSGLSEGLFGVLRRYDVRTDRRSDRTQAGAGVCGRAVRIYDACDRARGSFLFCPLSLAAVSGLAARSVFVTLGAEYDRRAGARVHDPLVVRLPRSATRLAVS